MSAEVLRYQQDIIIFLRLSRAVAGGITTKSNNYFLRFSKYAQLSFSPKLLFLTRTDS